MSDIQAACKGLINWLEEKSAQINDLMAQANKASQEDKNTEAYNQLVIKKAETIQNMPDEAEKYLAQLPDAEAEYPRQRIQEFAFMAGKALSLNSSFFMYLLLLADEEGQPTSLEVFIDELKKKAGL